MGINGPGGGKAPYGGGLPSQIRVADITTAHHGRRAEFAGVVGVIRGLAQTAAVGLTGDGRAVSVAGPRQLVLAVGGLERSFDFGPGDFISLLD